MIAQRIFWKFLLAFCLGVSVLVFLASSGFAVSETDSERLVFENMVLDLDLPEINAYQDPKLGIATRDTHTFIEKSFRGLQWLVDRDVLDRPFEITIKQADGTVIKKWTSSNLLGSDFALPLDQVLDNNIGQYTVELTDLNTKQTQSQDFSWGVLAMNLDRDVYLVGETADIGMSVLDSRGLMECNAGLSLEVRDKRPSSAGQSKQEDVLSTSDQTIQVTGSCPVKSYTDEPDYQAVYQFEEAGLYELELTATTEEGAFTIWQEVEVVDSRAVSIKRTGPTRIYPPVWYPMEIEFEVDENFSGRVVEPIPGDFLVQSPQVIVQSLESTSENPETGQVTASLSIEQAEGIELRVMSLDPGGDDKNSLVAFGDWEAGKTYTLRYEFKTPFESPEFFTLGPAYVESSAGEDIYTEKRAWQLAIDAEVSSLRPQNSTIGTLWTKTGCTNTTNLHTEVDDDPDSPTDSDYICGPNSTTGEVFLGIGPLPGNFPTGGADSVEIKTRHQESGDGNDTIDLYYQVFESDNSTAITSEEGSTTITQGSWDDVTYTPTITGTNTDTTWGSARLRIRQADNQNQSPDATNRAWVSAVEVNVTYTPPTITVSGNVYEKDTTTASSVCDGTTTNVAIIGTGGTVTNVSCNASTGVFSTTIDQVASDQSYVMWIDGDATDGATVVRYDGSGDSTNNIIYESTVMVMSDDTNPVDIIHMDTQDNGNDADIPYTATDATPDTLVVNSGMEFQVKLKSGVAADSTVFDPGGTVTTNATGGDFHIDDDVTAYLDTATNSIGADILIDGSSSLYIDANTTVGGGDITTSGTSATLATSTGTPTITMNATGSIGGGTTPSLTMHDLAVATGATTTFANDATINGGDLTTTSTGSITYSGTPTVHLDGTGTLGGGSGSITFYSLDSGDATTDTTTVSSDIVVDNTLTVNASQTFALGSQNMTVGSTSVSNSGGITQNGTTSGTGTITIYSSASGTATMNGSGTLTAGSLTVGDTSTTMTADFNTNDVAIDLAGNLTITANATLSAPATSSFTVGGNWSNSGTFTSNSGTVTFDAGDAGNTLAGTMTGGSEFGNLIFNNASGSWTFNAAASTSGDFTITAATDVTAPTGTLTVDGDFTGGSSFTHNNGNLTLGGSGTQTLAGATTFYDLTATATSTRALVFPASTTQTIAANGDISLTGSSCTSLLQLKSSSAGSAWTLTRNSGTGTDSFSYLEISDSTATNALTATDSVDAGGNTSWTITGSCIGASSLSTATGYSFQRKTFYDVTNDRHWMFYHDGDEIEIKYSSDDGATWNRDTALSYDTNDFSVWNTKISTTEYVWLAVASGDDILVRQGTLGASSITWDTDVATALDGTGATDTYSYPFLSLDSSNYIWVGARYYDGANYGFKTTDSTVTGDTDPVSYTFNTATQLIDTQADSNVYGTIVPLNTQDMYAVFAGGTALEGCYWDDSDGAWEDSAGTSCAVVSGGGEVYGPAKIDDAGDPGTYSGTARSIVRTSTGLYYAFFEDGGSCEVWKSETGNDWTQQDSGNSPACFSADYVAMSIDSSDILHLLYMDDDGTGVMYITYDTASGGAADDAFNSEELVSNIAANRFTGFDITTDSNDVPHLSFNYAFTFNQTDIRYANRVGGSWTVVTLETETSTGTEFATTSSIVINEDNIPELSYFNKADADLTVAVGDDNDPDTAGQWTIQDVDTLVNVTADQYGSSIGVDSAGNTWVAYVDDTTNYVTLVEHQDADAWTTWQTPVTNSNVGYEPSIVVRGTEIYVFYENDANDIAYDMYNGTSWIGEIVLQEGTYQDVKAKYSFLNNNIPSQVDYLFSDGTDIYWDYLQLPVNIDDVSDFGAMSGSGRQIVETSAGNKYMAVNDGGSCEIWKSADGQTWTEQDSTNNPACISASPISVAIDSGNVLHLAYEGGSGDLQYVTFDTADGGARDDAFNSPETADASTGITSAGAIALDTNDVPHIIYVDNATSNDILSYANRVGGSWTTVDLESQADTGSGYSQVDITISEDNIPEVSYINLTDADLTAAVGDDNDPDTAGQWTVQDVDTLVNVTADQSGTSIAVDKAGNTWIAYVDDTTNYITLVEHQDADVWTTWQTPVTNSNVGYEPSIVTQSGMHYIFYENDTNDIAYDIYDGIWEGETLLEIGTNQDVKARWSSQNWNDIEHVDYLYSDGTDIYWNELEIDNAIDASVNLARPNGLIGYWPFDANQGTTALDRSGFNNHGTLDVTMAEADWVTGKYESALYFDDISHRVVVSDINNFGDTDDFSLSVWINQDDLASTNAIIAKKESTDPLDPGYSLYISSTSGRINFIASDGTDQFELEYTGITTNQWEHIAIVFDQDNTSNTDIYLNGVKTSATQTGTLANVGAISNVEALTIGSESGNNDTNFSGDIDDVRIYDYALSSDEIYDTMLFSDPGRSIVMTSTGNLYSFLHDASNCEMWKSTDDGVTWTQQDSATGITCGFSSAIAIDSTDTIHLVYSQTSGDAVYRTFSTSTDSFGATATLTDIVLDFSITIDSNDVPHVAGIDTTDGDIKYKNKVGGSWNTTVTVEAVDATATDITISEDDYPEISYINLADNDLTGAVGASNNPTTTGNFTKHDIDTDVGDNRSTSIGVDSAGNTWIAYSDLSTESMSLVEHQDADAWTTWQTVLTENNTGYRGDIVIDDTDIYMYYEDEKDNLVFDMYDGTAWSGEVRINDGLYQGIDVRWSYLNNASYSVSGMNYLHAGDRNMYYDTYISEGSGQAAQDAIDTIPTGLSKTLSATVDTTNYDVHLTYVDDETTDQISYKRYDKGTLAWDVSAVNLDASATNAYPSISIDSDTGDLYAFYTDTSVGTIYYRSCDVSAAGSECSTSGDWAAETSWKTGTNVYTSSSYSEPSDVFALWGDGSSGVAIQWDQISLGGASPTYTQNDFEWFVQQDSVTLTNAWPAGSGADLAENEALTQIPASNEPLKSGDQIRIQMNVTVGTATLGATSQAFKLQYDAAEDCTAASGWTDVGAKASGSIWRFYDEASLADNTTEVNQISTSAVAGGYSETNPSGTNPGAVSSGQNMEWDWAVENNGATANTSYCFRMVKSDGTAFGTYNSDSYPKLTTAPGTADLLRHGNIFQNSLEQGFFWAD